MRPPRPALLRVLGASVALAWVLRAGVEGPARPEVTPCRQGVLVGEELWCDAEVERLAAACGFRPAPGARLAPPPSCAELGRMAPADQQALSIPVDLNRGSAEDLDSLPGIGPALARRIVEGRPYRDVGELLRVRGIGPKRLDALAPRARVLPQP